MLESSVFSIFKISDYNYLLRFQIYMIFNTTYQTSKSTHIYLFIYYNTQYTQWQDTHRGVFNVHPLPPLGYFLLYVHCIGIIGAYTVKKYFICYIDIGYKFIML